MMNKIFVIFLTLLLSTSLMAAGSDSSSDSSSNEESLYKDAVKLVKRAGKLEKAYKSDKKNPDILNYMGFTTRKTGNFEKAEKFYLEGLSLKPVSYTHLTLPTIYSV